MKFTVYDKETGRIICCGSCPEGQFEFQSQGHEIVEGFYSDSEYYWDDGFKAKPEKPDGFYEFDYSSKSWVLNTANTINQNRNLRNRLLASSDWTQLSDVSLSQSTKDVRASYRQALRNMTEDDFLNENFPAVPV